MKIRNHLKIDIFAENEKEMDELTDLASYISNHFSSAVWKWM